MGTAPSEIPDELSFELDTPIEKEPMHSKDDLWAEESKYLEKEHGNTRLPAILSDLGFRVCTTGGGKRILLPGL